MLFTTIKINLAQALFFSLNACTLVPDSYLDVIANIHVYPVSMGVVIGLLVMMSLLLLSAFISGSEVAFFSLSPNQKEELNAETHEGQHIALILLEKPQKLLATILIANNFVNVGIIVLSTFITESLFNFTHAPTAGILFQVVVVTFLLLLFGEIIPKVYATQHAVKFVRLTVYSLKIATNVLTPLSLLLVKATSSVNKRFQHANNEISMDDLSQVLDITPEHLIEDHDLLKGITRFGNITAKEIMRSRVDVTAVDIKTNFKTLYPFLVESGYSRIPVYSETFDNLKGVLYLKDLIPHLHKDAFRWQSIIRPPYFVPATKKINDLLHEFQTKKTHMAIVVDEYGGTFGIVTLKDILDEILGDIQDEMDDENMDYRKLGENDYIFEGKTLLNDFYRVTNLPDEPLEEIRGEAETLAGLILELKEEIPEEGEVIKYRQFTFKITAVDNRRIKNIQVIITKIKEPN